MVLFSFSLVYQLKSSWYFCAGLPSHDFLRGNANKRIVIIICFLVKEKKKQLFESKSKNKESEDSGTI